MYAFIRLQLFIIPSYFIILFIFFFAQKQDRFFQKKKSKQHTHTRIHTHTHTHIHTQTYIVSFVMQANNYPKLIEPGLLQQLNQKLHQSHAWRVQYQNMIYNTFLFACLTIGVGLVLWYKYKGKLSPLEKKHKEYQSQAYILQMLQRMNLLSSPSTTSFTTHLPHTLNASNYYP
jgi:hypothetical protein